MSSLAELSPADLTIEELTSRFEAGTLPAGDFTHRDHVRVGWELLRRHPLGIALQKTIAGVQMLAQQRGLPDLYHETITTFYILAIADSRAQAPVGESFSEFERRQPALLGKSRPFLLSYYSAERLDSDGARSSFLLPERPGAVVSSTVP